MVSEFPNWELETGNSKVLRDVSYLDPKVIVELSSWPLSTCNNTFFKHILQVKKGKTI